MLPNYFSLDYLLSYVGLPLWIGLGLAAIAAAWWFLGLRGAIAAAVGMVTLVAYRRGRDTQREEITSQIRQEQERSEGLINDEARIARERGRAAAERVRREAGGSPDSG